MHRFPLSRPIAAGNEHAYLEEVLRSERWSGGGPFTERCESMISSALDGCTALLVPSGTAALEMAILTLDIGPGDEVIMPSFTFSSCANAVVLRGAIPIFIDVRPDTLNIDESKIEEAITARTRAIMPVHYAGVCCEMEKINAVAAAHSLAVIEDAAQAYLSTYRGRAAGTLGTAAATSFHETKNIGCGEGGAFTTPIDSVAKKAEVIRDKGTNRSQFFRGEVDKYSWVDIGSSYVISEFQAAVLLAQLERARAITNDRLRLWNGYLERLAPLERRGLIELPTVPAECGHNAHIFRLLFTNEHRRDTVMRQLRLAGIATAFHFVPLHTSAAGKRWGRAVGQLNSTITASERLLRLPLYTGMNEQDLDFIVEHLIDATESAASDSAN
jgi:dTDP-4-amino-4,6-dideoxygalactose transaminase